MQKNLGKLDKVIRFLVATVLVVLYSLGIVDGTLGVLALVVAAVFVVTSLINFCPLYRIFGINTCKI
jgi:hypothetical protein